MSLDKLEPVNLDEIETFIHNEQANINYWSFSLIDETLEMMSPLSVDEENHVYSLDLIIKGNEFAKEWHGYTPNVSRCLDLLKRLPEINHV